MQTQGSTCVSGQRNLAAVVSSHFYASCISVVWVSFHLDSKNNYPSLNFVMLSICYARKRSIITHFHLTFCYSSTYSTCLFLILKRSCIIHASSSTGTVKVGTFSSQSTWIQNFFVKVNNEFFFSCERVEKNKNKQKTLMTNSLLCKYEKTLKVWTCQFLQDLVDFMIVAAKITWCCCCFFLPEFSISCAFIFSFQKMIWTGKISSHLNFHVITFYTQIQHMGFQRGLWLNAH